MIEFEIKTKERYQLIDITGQIKGEVERSKTENGLALVFVQHTSAGLLVTEKESGLIHDWQKFFEATVKGFDFLHNKLDNNADSHILAGILGESKIFIIENNSLVLGGWQSVFLAEFDGPRTRKIIIKIIKD